MILTIIKINASINVQNLNEKLYAIMICYAYNLFFHSLKWSLCGGGGGVGGGGGGHPLLSQSSLLYAACDNKCTYL